MYSKSLQTKDSDLDGAWTSAAAADDDLSREVYCVLGLPIDAVDMPTVLQRVAAAAAARTGPFLLSTPNVNFLANVQTDAEFRESLLASDLCPPDGKPIVWIARLLGVPTKGAVPGSDMFEALKSHHLAARPLKVFLFGATEPVAAAAAERINRERSGLKCVGWVCPGFGTLDELNEHRFIEQINSSDAQFLLAALGARKGQAWLLRNHHRLRVPVRSHLGTTINFQANTVTRAPAAMRKLGLEWLWRIKEEPKLFRRYWHDFWVLLRLVLTCALPLALGILRLRLRPRRKQHDLDILRIENDRGVTLHLVGDATAAHASEAVAGLREAVASDKQITIDLSQTNTVDSRFFGLFLMLRKRLRENGRTLGFVGVSTTLAKAFRRNGVGHLLSFGESDAAHPPAWQKPTGN